MNLMIGGLKTKNWYPTPLWSDQFFSITFLRTTIQSLGKKGVTGGASFGNWLGEIELRKNEGAP